MMKIREWNGKRIIFLGDTVTFNAAYCNFVEAYIVRNFLTECNGEFINLGLSRETVSGLTEENVPFKRPVLSDRLDSILSELKPDFVFFMYGMNDGLYEKLDEARFEAFKTGVLNAVDKINQSGAKLILMTPTPFDPRSFMGELSEEGETGVGPLAPYKYYNQTLRAYADWLKTLENKVFKIVDMFYGAENFMNESYMRNPQYSSGDGIHPNYRIHWGMACEILKVLFNITITKKPGYVDNPSTNEIFLELWRNNKMLSDHWREHFSGNETAMPLDEAMERYSATKETIAELVQSAPKPVEISNYKGYKRYDFNINGRECILVEPKTPKGEGQWIWRTEFFGEFDYADMALLERGYYVAYCRLSDMYGNPYAVKKMEKFRQFLCFKFKLNPRPVLFGFSRGGLYAVNYALKHHYNVSAIYLDAPVLDLKSWPSERYPEEFAQMLDVYKLTKEELAEFKGSPVDNGEKLAETGLPILIVAGDGDSVVPFSENTGVFAEKFRSAGGNINVIVKEGCGHHPHSLEDPEKIVEFVEKYSN